MSEKRYQITFDEMQDFCAYADYAVTGEVYACKHWKNEDYDKQCTEEFCPLLRDFKIR